MTMHEILENVNSVAWGSVRDRTGKEIVSFRDSNAEVSFDKENDYFEFFDLQDVGLATFKVLNRYKKVPHLTISGRQIGQIELNANSPAKRCPTKKMIIETAVPGMGFYACIPENSLHFVDYTANGDFVVVSVVLDDGSLYSLNIFRKEGIGTIALIEDA